jgi:ABC-type polysaccharide/polyol phosphate export permease
MKKIIELYSYRELLQNLVVKELKNKYKDSALGFFWSLIRPLMLMVIYTFVFSIIFNRGIKHFPLFLMAGLLPWNFFAVSLNMATNSIIGNAALIKKIYFPRELFPISVVLANAFSLLFEMSLLAVFLVIFGYNFIPYLPIVAVAFVLALVMTTGFALLVSSLTVRLRDLKQLVPVALTMGFYLTPIIYRLEDIPTKALLGINVNLQHILRLNPMSSVVQLFKLALYYNKVPGMIIFAGALLGALAVFAVGYTVFMRLSPSFAKEI